MSSSRQILDERLAKGEITSEQHIELIKQMAPTETVSTSAKAPDFDFSKIAKFWWVIPLIAAALWYSSVKNNLVIENLSSDSPFIAATTVTAVVYNDGAAKEYSYHIEKGSSETAYCPGRFFIGENERRTLRIRCAALTGFTGTFRFQTSTR